MWEYAIQSFQLQAVAGRSLGHWSNPHCRIKCPSVNSFIGSLDTDRLILFSNFMTELFSISDNGFSINGRLWQKTLAEFSSLLRYLDTFILDVGATHHLVKFLFSTGRRFGFSSIELRSLGTTVRNQFELDNMEGFGNIDDAKHLTSMLGFYRDHLLLLKQSNDALIYRLNGMENANKSMAQQLDNVYSLMLQNTSSALYSSSIMYTATSNCAVNEQPKSASINDCSASSSVVDIPATSSANALSQLKNIPALEIVSLNDLTISKVLEKWFQCGMESKKNHKNNNWSTSTNGNIRDKVSKVVRYCLDEIATDEELEVLKNGLPPPNVSNYLELKSLYTDTCYSIEKKAMIAIKEVTSGIPSNPNKRKSPAVNFALVSVVCKKLDAINKHRKTTN